MTQLNGPAGYTRAQHICRDAPELQIAAHALLPSSTSLFTRVFFAGISTTLAIKTCAGRCVGPQKRSLKNRVASVADAQMEAEGGSRGFFGVFVPSTVCPLRGAGGEEGGGGGTSRLRALADDQCLGFIFAISEGGGVGSCLIKSQLFYFTQEDLITFYVGVLDCLIITTFLATHPPNQLLRAAPSLLD